MFTYYFSLIPTYMSFYKYLLSTIGYYIDFTFYINNSDIEYTIGQTLNDYCYIIIVKKDD